MLRGVTKGPVCQGRLLFCASLSTLCKSETYSTSCHSTSRSPPRLAEIESNGNINAYPAGVIEELLQKQSERPLCIFFFFFFLTGSLKIPPREKLPKPLHAYYTKEPLEMVWWIPARWILLRVKARRTYFWLCQIFFFFASCLLASRMQTTAFVVLASRFLFCSDNTPSSYIQDPRSHTRCYYRNLTQQANCKKKSENAALFFKSPPVARGDSAGGGRSVTRSSSAFS